MQRRQESGKSSSSSSSYSDWGGHGFAGVDGEGWLRLRLLDQVMPRPEDIRRLREEAVE